MAVPGLLRATSTRATLPRRRPSALGKLTTLSRWEGAEYWLLLLLLLLLRTVAAQLAGWPPSLPDGYTAGCRIAREDARADRSLTFRGVPCHVAAFSRGHRIEQASAPRTLTRGAPARRRPGQIFVLAATVPTILSGFDIRAKEHRVELERHPRQTLASAQYYYVSNAGLSAFQQRSGRRRSIVIENMFSTRLRMHDHRGHFRTPAPGARVVPGNSAHLAVPE